MIFGIDKSAFKCFWNTPPKQDEWKFTWPRRIYQLFYPCKHSWIQPVDYDDDELHGCHASSGRRVCKWCGRQQIMVFHRYGRFRYNWINLPL